MIDEVKLIESANSAFDEHKTPPLNDEETIAAWGLSKVFFELLRSVIELYNQKNRFALDIITRSCFEYYVKILNIIEKGNYWSVQLNDSCSELSKIKLIDSSNQIISIHADEMTIEK